MIVVLLLIAEHYVKAADRRERWIQLVYNHWTGLTSYWGKNTFPSSSRVLIHFPFFCPEHCYQDDGDAAWGKSPALRETIINLSSSSSSFSSSSASSAHTSSASHSYSNSNNHQSEILLLFVLLAPTTLHFSSAELLLWTFFPCQQLMLEGKWDVLFVQLQEETFCIFTLFQNSLSWQLWKLFCLHLREISCLPEILCLPRTNVLSRGGDAKCRWMQTLPPNFCQILLCCRCWFEEMQYSSGRAVLMK